MTTQLDLFGQVEAADQRAADLAAERARLQYERILARADLGYGLMSEAASGWPNGVPAGGREAVRAAYAEQERGYQGERTPGAPGSCRRCDHRMVDHYLSRWECERECDCPALLAPVTDHLEVSVLPGAILLVRTHADVMIERWERHGATYPGAASAATAAMETIA